jgi:outer membrane protein assembly factor BamA
MRTFFYILFLSVLSLAMQAQSPVALISQITIEGNKSTKDRTILRELSFSLGDTIAQEKLDERLRESELLLMNTGLFNRVQIYFKNWIAETNEVHINVTVWEAWYIYPIPLFELADRNFNVWWVDQKRSLKRTNIGINFSHMNFSGRADRLELVTKFGYTRNFSLKYQLPFFNASQSLGLLLDVSYFQNKEVNYMTSENKQLFYRDDDRFVYQRFKTRAGLSWRPGLRQWHDWELSYNQNKLASVISQELNPDFFLDGQDFQRFFSLSYRFRSDFRDRRFYALNGHYFEAILEKDGLGIMDSRNALTLFLEYNKYWELSKKWSFALFNNGKLSILRGQQPYNDNRAVGFNQKSIRGYELYIIDGLDMMYAKSSLRLNLINKTVTFGKLIPIPALRYMPLQVYLAFNNDVGIVHSPYKATDNPFNNRLLWGGGLGLDFVVYNTRVFSLEYSFNHLFENGLFIHLNLNI